MTLVFVTYLSNDPRISTMKWMPRPLQTHTKWPWVWPLP